MSRLRQTLCLSSEFWAFGLLSILVFLFLFYFNVLLFSFFVRVL